MRAKITQIGNSTGLIIPKEMVDRMNIKKGDDVFLSPTEDGFTVVRNSKEIDEQMQAAKLGMAEYSHALRKLAE